MSESWVYFIRAGTYGPIKIGYTGQSLNERRALLQSGNHERLHIVCAVPGTMETESQYHVRFAAYRISRGEHETEWFDPGESLLRFIETVRGEQMIAGSEGEGMPDLVCDACGDPIDDHDNGMLSWLPFAGAGFASGKKGGIDFTLHHKGRCDKLEEAYWMPLTEALGRHGLSTLIDFLCEPDCDRASLRQIIHRLHEQRSPRESQCAG